MSEISSSASHHAIHALQHLQQLSELAGTGNDDTAGAADAGASSSTPSNTMEFSPPAQSTGAPPAANDASSNALFGGEESGDPLTKIMEQLTQLLKALLDMIGGGEQGTSPEETSSNDAKSPSPAPAGGGGGAPAPSGANENPGASPAPSPTSENGAGGAQDSGGNSGAAPAADDKPAGQYTGGPEQSDSGQSPQSAGNSGAAGNTDGASEANGAAGADNTDGAEAADGTSPKPSTNTGSAGNGGEVTEFETMEPGEAPNISRNEDGFIKLDKVVDDSFISEEDRAAIKDSISENKDMDFYKENFESEEDIYNFQVARMNLESARGTTLENDSDAQGTGGGSFGLAHLHDKFGLEAEKYGSPLNTEGWSKDEVAGDMSKYMDLVMRSDEGNYQFSKEQGKEDPLANAMGMWWTGSEDNAAAGNYYLSAMSQGKGVNHETGSNML